MKRYCRLIRVKLSGLQRSMTFICRPLTKYSGVEYTKQSATFQADKNASFNNKTFLEKRRILAKYENASSETQFVPICTRNVFFKHYSPNATNPLIWDREAGKDYVRAMMNVIGNFIGVTSFDNFDKPNSQKIEFGLIRK